jgi:flagellar protein FlgJ
MQSAAYVPAIGKPGAWQFDNPRLTTLQSTLGRVQQGAPGDDEASRAEAARQLASLFVNQLLTAMRKTIPKSGLWDGGRAQDIYEQMTDERLADLIVSTGQFGLAKTIHEELLKYS